MAKTLRIRTRTGWVTKPVLDIPENRLSAQEVDDNFLETQDYVDALRSLADKRQRDAFRKEKGTPIAPSLLLDFEADQELDPRVTFARASTARYYDGVTTAKAEENLLLRSQDYSTSWTVTNLTPVTGKTAPDGTSTATEFTAGAANAVLTQGYTAVAGSYTFSVWLRRVTGTGDIEIAADNGTWTTKVITGTWARYDVTQTVTAGSKTAGVRVVTSGDAIEVWGAQLEQRSAVTAYTATTTQPITNYVPVLLTAQNNEARFDHTPTTGAALGLEIEEQRTNLQVYSQEFDNAAWTKSNSSVTSNTIVAPDGTLTGDKLVEDTATGEHAVGDPFSFTSGTTYTGTIYAKKAERTLCRFGAGNAATWGASVIVDLSNGTITSTVAGSGTVADVGNGWYRISVTGAALATASTNFGVRLVSTGTTISYTGDGYSGVFIWGAQLEEGAVATSYIPTTTTALTRSADAASMTGTNFSDWFNAAEGTVYFEAQTAQGSGSYPFSLFGSSTSNRIYANYVTNERIQSGIRVNGTFEAAVNTPNSSAPLNTVGKGATAYKVNDFGFSWNGAAALTDTSTTLPIVQKLDIGNNGGLATNWLNGTIRKIAYYPVRLSNAQLQALTA